LVARIQKRFRLRVMGAANDVAVQLVAKHFRVMPHHPRRHRATYVWIYLVPVESKQLQPPPVEKKAVQLEAGVAQSDADAVIVDGFVVHYQRRDDVVETRCVDIPQREVAQFRQREPDILLTELLETHRFPRTRDNAGSIPKLNLDSYRF